MIQLLQLFFEKGESIGIASLTTPIDEPPKIERANTTNPNAYLANLRTTLKFSLFKGRNKTNPVIPRTNPIHKSTV